jgi:hypothetical protein
MSRELIFAISTDLFLPSPLLKPARVEAIRSSARGSIRRPAGHGPFRSSYQTFTHVTLRYYITVIEYYFRTLFRY